MRVMAIDYGDARTGVAISDPSGLLSGFTTVILIQLFSSSLVMISLGIIGYYLAKLYEEIKDRPRYLIAETCGEDRHASSHEKTP